MHLSGVGAELLSLNLKGTQSLADFLQQVAMRVAEAEPDEWIVGRGWIETFWKPAAFPSRHDLDAVAPDHPVYLSRVDGHGAVVNTRALSIARITRDTEDPAGGQILRDRNGNPTGMLLDNAMGIVARHLPDQESGYLRRTLILGSEEYAKRGWTGVQIAGTSWREAEIIRDGDSACARQWSHRDDRRGASGRARARDRSRSRGSTGSGAAGVSTACGPQR